MEKKLTYTVGEEDGGSRLEQILRSRMKLSRREISRAKFLDHGICVDGISRKVNYQVKAGERIEVLLESKEASSSHLIPREGELCVCYEDEDVIVVEKPAGVVVHPCKGHYSDTLANRLTAYLQKKQQDSVIRIMGRLDKDTSGLVLAVKNKAAGSRLEVQRRNGEFYKTYLAVTQGIPYPERGKIEKPIAPDLEQREKMCIDTAGKQAVTQYEVIKKTDCEALVRVWIFTGRMHQIRVHMASIGCPLKGDVLYGEKRCEESIERKQLIRTEESSETQGRAFRLALHAQTLHFRQPFTGEEVTVSAPISEEELGYTDSAGRQRLTDQQHDL